MVLRTAARRMVDVSDRPLVIYTRLSRVKKPTSTRKRGSREWQTISIARQERICREWAAATDQPLWPEVFADNNLSAWKPDRKRPDWDRLQVLLGTGEVGGVLVFDADRFCRRNFDLEVFLSLADRFEGMRLASPTAVYDLGSPDSQDMLRMRVQMANREVVQIRKRVMAVLEENARAGMPPSAGRRSFGFVDSLSNEQVPAEAEIIRECAKRLLGGESLAAVTEDLNRRGVRTVNGQPFHPTALRHTLAKPRNAGIVYWQGEEVSRMDGEPILDETTWRDLVAMFESRRRGRRPEGVNPLVGVVYCGRCGRKMSGERLSKDSLRVYRCKRRRGDHYHQGCYLTIEAEPLETDAAERVIGWMSDPTRAARLAEITRSVDAEQAAAAQALSTAKEALTDLYTRSALGEIPDDVFTQSRDRLTRIINERQAVMEQTTAPAHVKAVTTAEARRLWNAGTGLEKRELARAAIRSITVHENPGHGRAFTRERVAYEMA